MEALSGYELAAVIVFGVILLFTVRKLFSIPLRRILGFFVNTALGFAALGVLSQLDTYVHIGFNLLNAVVIGIFGLPGLGLLWLLGWIGGA